MTPIAAYRAKVARLVMVKVRLANSCGWHERVGERRMWTTNAGSRQAADERRDGDDGVGPAAWSGLGERERGRRERDDGDDGTADVEVGGVLVAGLGDRPRAGEHDRGDGNVDEERPPPAGAVDEPATDERAERAGDAAER